MIYRVQPISFFICQRVCVCVCVCVHARALYIFSILVILPLGFGEDILVLHSCTQQHAKDVFDS